MAAGDHRAFRELFDAWHARVLFYAGRLMGGTDTAACRDIVQDAFVLLWERREALGTALAAKAFVYVTIKNKVWCHLRDTANRRRLLGHWQQPPIDPTDQMAITAEVCGQIQQAMEELAPQTRRVMEHLLGGMSVEQSAAELGVSENTVKTLRKAAYRHLRERLEHLRGLLLFLF